MLYDVLIENLILIRLRLIEKEEEGVAPHFTTPIKPLMVEEHKPATLECIVTGTPAPEVKWYRGEKEVKPKKGTEITFNPETGEAKLTILEPTPEDEKVYRVRAVNKFGRAECRANLLITDSVIVTKPEVMYAPKITKPLPAMIAEKGKPLVLTADFESKPQGEVKWYKNGTEIKPSPKQKIEIYENKTELIIPDATKKDSGKYEIRVQNPAGEARSSGSVSVTKQPEGSDAVQAPRFIEPLQPQIVTPGEVVIMEARVESYPTASFQWFHNDHAIVVSVQSKHQYRSRYSVDTNTLDPKFFQSSPEVRIVTLENRSVLLVKEIVPEFAGSYTCRAENVAGSVTCTASVNIIEETWEEAVELVSPTFVRKMSPVRVMDGESVHLTCVVQGKPIPRVEWFHDNKPIKEGKEITILQDTEGVCSLAITEVFPEDAGEYTCQAVNHVGEAICITSLLVEGNDNIQYIITYLIHSTCRLNSFQRNQFLSAYEYVPDSEIASSIVATSLVTGQSGSEEDLLSPKVN